MYACDVAAPFNILCVMSCVHYMEAVCFEQYLINHLLFKISYYCVQTYCIIQAQTKFIHIDLLINVFFIPFSIYENHSEINNMFLFYKLFALIL